MEIMNLPNMWLFLAVLPVIAFLYASVGHGGASGYLGLMVLFSFEPAVMKPAALLLNLFVAAISFYHFRRCGHFKFNLFYPFAIGSIPMSFLGGALELDSMVYKQVLGVLLVFAILRLVSGFRKRDRELKTLTIWQGLVVGGVIGLFSGLIGIGGGIILTPLILIMRWGTMKEAAAVSALFIWVNSAAGITGQFIVGFTMETEFFIFVVIALIGGYFGGYFGSSVKNNKILRYTLALVLLLASTKLILTQ